MPGMHTEVNRRQFLATLAAMPLVVTPTDAAQVPIVDGHIHLFDRTRPQGAFWPPKDDAVPGVSALPSRYRDVVRPFGIVGAIAVEASPWLEDNQWVLDQAASDPIILGHIGFLDPGLPDFGRNLERFHRSNLYLGVRYSNRNNRDGGSIADAINDAGFVSSLKLLADAGLSLDLGMTPDPAVLLRVTDKVPSLRVVIPHLPNARMPDERTALDAYIARLRELATRPHVYMKLSEVIKRVNGKASTDVSLYRDRLDQLWAIFGEDRVIFGSDWPNSEHVGALSDVMTVASEYIATKGPAASEKVFWRNSAAAYRWVRRDPSQPHA
jgi:predicted TIM-barrel fold metal-dependent hydrolase